MPLRTAVASSSVNILLRICENVLSVDDRKAARKFHYVACDLLTILSIRYRFSSHKFKQGYKWLPDQDLLH